VDHDRNSLRAELRRRFPRDHWELLPALHFLQHRFGYLPGWAMEVVGWHLGIPSSEVYGAATSYTELRTDQPGAGIVRVCTGLSCRLNGGAEILEAVRRGLRSASGVTLEETPCAFLCGLAPAVEVDGRWRGRVDPASIGGLTREVVRP
jgi:NADH:ubiquinone oxidoreductase subunit E